MQDYGSMLVCLLADMIVQAFNLSIQKAGGRKIPKFQTTEEHTEIFDQKH